MGIFKSDFSRLILFLLFVSFIGMAESQIIRGKVYDLETGLPLYQAHVVLNNGAYGTNTDSAGVFIFNKLPSGTYEVSASYLGYEKINFKSMSLTDGRERNLEIGLKPLQQILNEITVKAAPFRKGIDVPDNLRSLYAAEIQRNPGSDNDISRVIRALPGVTSLASFRNDLIIRGGAPNENRFFLDEVEIPVINHLVTQGASGGAFSMINSNNLREVEYLSSTFPANRGNALSSVFGFTLKDGNRDSLQSVVNVGGTEAGITMDGPLSSKAGFLFAVRRSYRQYLLKALKFAFFPVYNDLTAKVKYRITPNSTLTFVTIGAIDQFRLNTKVGNNEIQRYLLDNLPQNNQSNFTSGLVYKYISGNSVLTLVTSKSGLFNEALKYKDNIVDSQNLLLNYKSTETSSRARVEYAYQLEHFRFLTGFSFDHLKGNYDVYNRVLSNGNLLTVDYNADLGFSQYGVFAQISKSFFKNRLNLTAGVRSDGSDYNKHTSDLRQQLSGRVNLTASVSDRISLNLSAANYFQLPPLMTMSYRNGGEAVNRDVIRFLESKHLTAGFKWENRISGRLSVEGFYKYYPNYMFSLRDNISLAHIPVDFGVFGNFPVSLTSKGRAYGAEVFYQQRFYKGFYGMTSFTISKSAYQDINGSYLPSTWDARRILSFTLGKKFKERWQVGINWRAQSALPFTPFNLSLSGSRPVWDITNQGIRDFTRLQAMRGKSTNFINLRVDRTYYLPKGQLNLYIDFENILADADSQQVLILDRQRDSSGNLTDDGLIINPDAPYADQNYRLRSIANAQGAFIPTFGMIYKW